MSELDYHNGLAAAHQLLIEEHERIRRQIESAPSLFGIFPSRVQLELFGAAKALTNLSTRRSRLKNGQQ